MPKITDKKIYLCNICDKMYTSPDAARACEAGHDIVLLPIERSDLKRLILYINSGEQKLLTKSLVNLLIKYSNIKPE